MRYLINYALFFPFFSSLLIYHLYASFLFSFFILLVHKLFLCFPHFSSLVCIYFIFSSLFFNCAFFLSLTSITSLHFFQYLPFGLFSSCCIHLFLLVSSHLTLSHLVLFHLISCLSPLFLASPKVAFSPFHKRPNSDLWKAKLGHRL